MTLSLLSTGGVTPDAIAPSGLQSPFLVAQPVADKARLYDGPARKLLSQGLRSRTKDGL